MPANTEIILKHSVVREGLPLTLTIHELRLGECRTQDIQRIIEEAQSRGEDTPRLTEILRAAKSRLRTVFAATTPAGEHVGFGLIQLGSGENANFTGAVVRKDWREKGLFGKLVEARIRWAVSQNHRTVSVHVLPTSENVIREFEISGRRFVECEREREDVFLYGQNGKKFVIDLTGATI